MDAIVAGAINWDVNLFVNHFPRPGEESTTRTITRVPGGKAANVAVAMARLLGSGRVGLIGALGMDEVGKQQLRILREEGVDTTGIKKVQGESGQAYVVTDKSGENIIYMYFGANATLAPKDIDLLSRRSFFDGTHVLVIMDPPLEAAEALAGLGAKAGANVISDMGVRCSLGHKALKNVIRSSTHISTNEHELKDLTKRRAPTHAADLLRRMRRELKLIVKQGSRGCLMVHRDRKLRIGGVPLKQLGYRVVNTVGCGDAFIGAFSAFLAMGRTEEEALRKANLAGAFKATKQETRGSPTLRQLEAFEVRYLSLIAQ